MSFSYESGLSVDAATPEVTEEAPSAEVEVEIGETSAAEIVPGLSDTSVYTWVNEGDGITIGDSDDRTIEGASQVTKEDLAEGEVVQQEPTEEPSGEPTQTTEQTESAEQQEPTSEQPTEAGDEHAEVKEEPDGAKEDEAQADDVSIVDAPAEESVLEIESSNVTLDTQFQLMEEEDLLPEEELTKYIWVEETVMDDLGKEVKVKQKIPIIRESRRFERISTQAEGEESKTHKFLETITRVIKKSALNEEGELEEKESEVTEVIEHAKRPDSAVIVFTKRVNEKGEVETVVVPIEEPPPKVVKPPEIRVEREERRKISYEEEKPRLKKRKIIKIVKQQEPMPCVPGKMHEVLKTMEEEIEQEEEEEIDLEDYLLGDEELTEEEQLHAHEVMQKRREAKIARLKDNLRTVLVRLALAEKKRNLYMQLISISSEVKEDILNPPDPDKPSFKVPKKVRTEDKFRRMYQEKLMEYRELRSVILVRLATEKKRKEEVKHNYDVIASQVAALRKQLEDKLTGALSKLHPRNDPIFKTQSPQRMVKRVLELTERLDNETKELMYKKKQMYLAKQSYDQITENEQGLSYRYALASKELKLLVSKNNRRNEKLESLKTTMQKESLAVTHINQKCDAILKTTDEKKMKLQSLNQSLIRARQDRKDVHQARRKVDSELRQENARIQLKNHPSLLKEHQLVEDLLKAKQAEFHHLKRQCLSSLQHLNKASTMFNPSTTPH